MTTSEEDSDPNYVHVLGSLADFVETAKAGNRTLNCLSIPLGAHDTQAPSGLSTDSVAEKHTMEQMSFPPTIVYLGRVFGLAATSHASHRFHGDPHGQATWIDPKTGLKYWVLAIPDSSDTALSSIDAFGQRFDTGLGDKEGWTLYSVLIGPGDRL